MHIFRAPVFPSFPRSPWECRPERSAFPPSRSPRLRKALTRRYPRRLRCPTPGAVRSRPSSASLSVPLRTDVLFLPIPFRPPSHLASICVPLRTDVFLPPIPLPPTPLRTNPRLPESEETTVRQLLRQCRNNWSRDHPGSYAILDRRPSPRSHDSSPPPYPGAQPSRLGHVARIFGLASRTKIVEPPCREFGETDAPPY